MKAFTVYQPYAHAIVAGVKHYETRPRRTHIRGRVAVHAGRLDEVQATKHLKNGEFWAVLEAAGGGGNLPRGAVIGTVEIVDCVPVEELVDSLDNRERLLGDYSPVRVGASKPGYVQNAHSRLWETRVVELGGTDMKCRECEFASVHTYPRNGNSNSAHVGHFGQEASYCNHPKCPPPGPLLFYGKTAPRYCPLRKKGENT